MVTLRNITWASTICINWHLEFCITKQPHMPYAICDWKNPVQHLRGLHKYQKNPKEYLQQLSCLLLAENLPALPAQLIAGTSIWTLDLKLGIPQYFTTKAWSTWTNNIGTHFVQHIPSNISGTAGLNYPNHLDHFNPWPSFLHGSVGGRIYMLTAKRRMGKLLSRFLVLATDIGREPQISGYRD